MQFLLSILYVFLPLIQLQYLRRPLDATKFYAAVLWMCSLEASSRESVKLTWSTAAEECASVLRPWRSDLSGIQTFRPHCDHNYQVTVTEEKKKVCFWRNHCVGSEEVCCDYTAHGGAGFFSLLLSVLFLWRTQTECEMAVKFKVVQCASIQEDKWKSSQLRFIILEGVYI